ncbi:MAG: transglutaminase domain-containing protein [Cyclobacteriaceae bacterium]|nr:transglutaminase domain-containing protein [Cyclobacteriaceae bacterium]
MKRKSFDRMVLMMWLFFLASCAQKKEANVEIPGKIVKKVSIDEIESGIKAFIEKKTEENGGYFEVSDRGHEFKMKLVRVHTEYLANLGPKSHFACVDLADVSGDVYDVDFFLSGEPGAMDVTETSVHKLNGKPYYAWKQREDKTWNRVPVKDAATRLLGVVEGTDFFEFNYRVELPEINHEAKLWIPIASTDKFQSIEITSMNIPVDYKLLKDKEYNNTILYLEPGNLQSKKSIEINYRVQRQERGPVDEPAPGEDKYLSGNQLMPVGGRFVDVASDATRGRDGNSLMKARALYDYIIDNMRYMKYGTYGKGDSNYACDVKTGNCTEFHSFFISLARSLKIPARFAVGASIPSERNEGGIDGYHCWAEFYAEGKWWPIDISEANKYTALATYYFGHHPANRIELSQGRDLMVEPGPASGPINFLAYPILEINGKEVATKTTFSFTRLKAQTL